MATTKSMSGVLFCELSGALVATTADLNKVVSPLRLPDLYMLSKETAIAFADDQEEAISLVLKGKSQEPEAFLITFSP
jgi:hypothetical protein